MLLNINPLLLLQIWHRTLDNVFRQSLIQSADIIVNQHLKSGSPLYVCSCLCGSDIWLSVTSNLMFACALYYYPLACPRISSYNPSTCCLTTVAAAVVKASPRNADGLHWFALYVQMQIDDARGKTGQEKQYVLYPECLLINISVVLL